MKEYNVLEMHSLRVSRSSRIRFEQLIGFMEESPKYHKLKKMNETVATYKDVPFDAVESLVHFTVGIFLVQDVSKRKRERVMQIMALPLIYAVVIGIGLNISGISIPDIAIQPLKLIGSITIPLALISLGARLGELKVFSWKLPAAALFVRFVLGFAIGFAFVEFFNITGIVRAVILLLSIMPPAVNSFVLNQKFGKQEDSEAAASAVFIGTLLSIFVVGAVLAFLTV